MCGGENGRHASRPTWGSGWNYSTPAAGINLSGMWMTPDFDSTSDTMFIALWSDGAPLGRGGTRQFTLENALGSSDMHVAEPVGYAPAALTVLRLPGRVRRDR